MASRHPELDGQRDRVLETLSDPERMQLGDSGELLAIRFYEQTPVTSKFLVVAYREIVGEEGFVITPYFTSLPIRAKDDSMDAVKILDQAHELTWDYDDDADVLYLSVGDPRPAVGLDIGDGGVVRYDETRHEVVGLTVIGLRNRLVRRLAGSESQAGSRDSNLSK
jgi:uncharacterized protein YuzE